MIKTGDVVLVRLFNTPDARFFGQSFEAVVIGEVEPYRASSAEKRFCIRRTTENDIMTVTRKEIRRTL